MADREITWQGLTLGGTSSYVVEEFSGWDETPALNDFSTPRVRGHGDHMGDLYSQARIVTVSGTIVDSDSRDLLVSALQAVTTVNSATAPLTVDLFGQRLTSHARIIRKAITAGPLYAAGAVPFALQWRCPDPLRYGEMRSASTGLPSASGGLTYPLAYPLTYGVAGASGQVTLYNEGTADAPIAFLVSGPLPLGFELSAIGRRITYADAVPAGQVVTLDTAAGSVLLEGTADRRASLVNADWLSIPAGTALTVQFSSLGGAFSAAATVQANYRPAFW